MSNIELSVGITTDTRSIETATQQLGQSMATSLNRSMKTTKTTPHLAYLEAFTDISSQYGEEAGYAFATAFQSASMSSVNTVDKVWNLAETVMNKWEAEHKPIEVPVTPTIDPDSYAGLIQREKELSHIIKTGTDTVGEVVPVSGIQEASVELETVKRQLDEIRHPTEPAEPPIPPVEPEIESFSRLQSVLQGVLSTGVKLGSKLLDIFKSLGSKLRSVFISIGKGGQSDLKHSLKTLLKYGLGVRSLFALFRRLRSTAIESLKTLAQQVPEFGKAFNEFKQGMTQMKGSIGTIIQPLATALIPIFQQIVSVVTAASNAIAKFFAVLAGQGVIYKATAAQKDYTKAASGGASATKKQLMAFDELNRLDDNSGGGGGSDVNYTTEAIEADDALSKLAETIKNYWLNGEFAQLGSFLGQQVNQIIAAFDPTVVSTKIGTWIQNIITLLNSFTDTVEWNAIGGKISGAVMSLLDPIDGASVGSLLSHKFTIAFDVLGGFFADFDPKDLGTKIGQGINAFVTNIQESMSNLISSISWEDWGTAIANVFNNISWRGLIAHGVLNLGKITVGILTILTKAIETINWGEIGSAIVEGIAAIPWSEVLSTVGSLLRVIGNALIELLLGALDSVLGTNLAGRFHNWVNRVIQEVSDETASQLKASSDVYGNTQVEGGQLAISRTTATAAGIEDDVAALVDSTGTTITILEDKTAELAKILQEFNESDMTQSEALIKMASLISDIDITGLNELETAMYELEQAAPAAFNPALLDTARDNWLNYGNWVGEGFTGGFEESSPEAVNAAAKFVESVDTELHDGFEIGSPSKLTERYGGWVVDGFVNGLNTFSDKLTPWITAYTQFLEDIVNTTLTSVNSMYTAFESLGGSRSMIHGALSSLDVPQLALGTIVPSNRNFLAALGGQSQGINSEASLDAIVNAIQSSLIPIISDMKSNILSAVQDGINSSEVNANVYLDGRQIASSVTSYQRRNARALGG